MIKTIFIDWDKTLSTSVFWEQLKDMNSPYNHYFDRLEEFFFKQNEHLVNNWMLGKYNSERVCKKISKAIGLSCKAVFNELAISASNMVFVDFRIPEVLKRIRKKGTKLVVATDNMDTFRRFTIPGMKLYDLFDDFLISNELKCFKYSVSSGKLPFFEGFLKINKLTYKEVILIDDSVEKTGYFEKIGFRIKYIKDKKDLLNHLNEYIS